MDYVVGSVAALISGNVTPSRPKLLKRALTPKKRQTSPNVTPTCEGEDRSIFLSPTMQKKKEIVKKSPKRIFQNPDLDVTNDGEENSPLISPKGDKVKKHLKEKLEAEDVSSTSIGSPKSPKKGKGKSNKSIAIESPKDKNQSNDISIEIKNLNESTPKKNKKKKNATTLQAEEEKSDKENLEKSVEHESLEIKEKSPKKKRKSTGIEGVSNCDVENNGDQLLVKKKKPNKNSNLQETEDTPKITVNQDMNGMQKKQSKKKNKKRNKKKKQNIHKQDTEILNQEIETLAENTEVSQEKPSKNKKKKGKNVVNPNAITNQDSESEHESDDEIESENDLNNKEVLDTGPVDESSDEEDQQNKKEKKQEKAEENKDEVKRTLFVGNVLFNKKCKKEIKKIFSKYGQIQTIRIRTIPVKDARVTPKLAVIKNELHPDRTTVNVYVKFQDASSVDKALAENNTKLNDHHLRVTRSDSSGAVHDPRRSLFVGNLPFAIEDDTLRAKFQGCGDIESVRVIRDRKTNAGKGFGYVNFASKDGVELALSMSEEDLTIKNRILRVKRCSLISKGRRNEVQKPNNQSERRPFNRMENRSGNRMDNRSGNRMDNRSMNRTDNRSGNRMDNRSGNRMDSRSGNRMDNRSGNRMGNGGNINSRPQGPPQNEGAYRRIANKRQSEEGGGPPNKMSRNITQPTKEKKPRKEFVGMTSEKKKKHKFNKGQKKKKVLSEILTK